MKKKDKGGKLNIVVSGSPFHGNFGSMAMVVATIKKMSSAFPEATFYKGSIFKNEDIRNYRKVFSNKKLNIYGFNGERFSIKLTAPLLLFFSVPFFRKADLIIEVPGEIPSDISLFSQFSRFLLAKIFNKPLIIFGCSLGPYKHTFTEYVAKKVFNNTDLLIIRERQTAKYLDKLGVVNYHLTADTAFLLKNQKSKDTKEIIDINKPYIGLSIKGPYFSFSNYERIIMKTIEFLLNETKENILVIPHSQDDICVSNKVFRQANNSRVRILKNNELTPEELKEIISHSSFYIGSRVHSSIAAVSNRVPTIFLIPRNDHRGRGTMKFFDLDQVVVDPSKEVTPTIRKIVNVFKQKDKIERKIIENLSKVKQLSRENFILLSKFIKQTCQNDK